MVLLATKGLDQATDTDTAAVVDCRRLGVEETLHTFRWHEGVSVGVVEIEEAPAPDYDGAWMPVQTVTFDGSTTPAPKVQTVRITGSFAALRHRISTPVEDGSVSSRIDASGDA